jgi:pimeloyl-ACP methyl ester carboxylesterase
MASPVQRRTVRLPQSGIEIALLDWGGDGPLALLHHANGFCAGTWGLVAEPLSAHFRVIAMDARGHGDSSKPEDPELYRWEVFGEDIIGVAEQLSAEHPDGRIALGLGHSFGGTSMLLAAARRRELFERLVLVDPVLILREWAELDPARPSRGPSLADSARNRQMVWPDRETARRKWRDKAMFASWDPRALDLYLEFGVRDRADGNVEVKCPGWVEAAIFETGDRLDPLQIARDVPVPTRMLWATRGNFPRFIFESVADALPDGDVRDIDAGHLATMERPDLVTQAVREFAL